MRGSCRQFGPAIALAVLCAGAACAQISPVSGLSAASSGAGAVSVVQDVFLGKNVLGPYVLSWKALDPGSETVVVNGRRLIKDSDYALDAAAGVLQFMRPLRSGQVARVDYRCIPGVSRPNTAAAASPMQFDLYRAGGGALSVSATYRPGAEGSASGKQPGLMLLNIGGQTRAAGSALTSRLVLDAQGGRLEERGAVQLGQESKTSIGLFKASFARAGRGFSASKETGIAAGKQLIELGGTLNPIGGIQAAATFRQTEDLAEQGRGVVTTVVGKRLSGTLGAAIRLQATRTETTVDSPDGSSSHRVADRIQLDRKLSDRVSATALFERDQAEAGDSRAVSQNSSLSLRTQPVDGVTVLGSVQNKLTQDGAEDAAKVQVEAAPAPGIKLGALLGDRIRKEGVTRDRQASLQYARGNQLTLSGYFNLRAEGETETLVRGVSATARPLSFVEVSGGVKLRDNMVEDVPQPDAPDTYSVNVSLRLLNDGLKLTGGYVANPENEKGVIARTRARNIGLQSTFGQFDLAGGYSLQDSYLDPSLSASLNLTLGWRFLPNSSIVTSIKEALTSDSSLLLADTYSLSLTHRVGTAFDLMVSGVMTTYQKDGFFLPNRDYKAEARLGYRF